MSTTSMLEEQAVTSSPAATMEYPQVGERIMGHKKELEIAAVSEDQPTAEKYFNVVDQAGVDRRIYLDNGSWFLIDELVTRDEELVIVDARDDDYDGEKFRAEMALLNLSAEKWHQKLEAARSAKESASSPADIYKTRMRATILIEIVNRVDPQYYEGRRRRY